MYSIIIIIIIKICNNTLKKLKCILKTDLNKLEL